MLQAIVDQDQLEKGCKKLPEINLFLETFFIDNQYRSWDFTCAEYFRRIEREEELIPYQHQLTQAFAEIFEPEYRVNN